MTFLPFGRVGRKLKALKSATRVSSHTTRFRNCAQTSARKAPRPPIAELIPLLVGFSLNGSHLDLEKPHVTYSKRKREVLEVGLIINLTHLFSIIWRREWDSILVLNPKLISTDFKRLAQST